MSAARRGLVLVALASMTATVARAAPIERIAAIVDGAIVLESDVAARPLAELIDAELIAAGARGRRVSVTPAEVDLAIKEIRVQNQLDDAAFDAALASAGHTMPSYRRMVTEQLIKLRLIGQLFPTLGGPERGPAMAAWLDERRRTAYIERRTIKTASAPATTWRGRAISAITFVGEPLSIALPSVVRVGAAAEPELIARAARALWATGMLEDLEIDLDEEGRLQFTARPLPRLRQLRINERRATPAETQELGLATGDPVDVARLHHLMRRWRAAQQRLGYYWIEASQKLARVGKTEVDVVISSRPGPKAVLEARVEGNHAVERATLDEGLVYTPGELLDPDDRDWQTQVLRLLYVDRGYLDAELKATVEPAADRRRVTVRFSVVNEGVVHRLSAVAVTGELLGNEQQTIAALGLAPEMVFGRSPVLDAVTRLQRRFEAVGRGYVGVDVGTVIDADKRVAITLRTKLGKPGPRFGSVVVLGREDARCHPKELAKSLSDEALEPFRVSRLTTLLALVEQDCRIVAQSRNYGAEDEVSDLRLIVRPRTP